jgi:hypothetical protein
MEKKGYGCDCNMGQPPASPTHSFLTTQRVRATQRRANEQSGSGFRPSATQTNRSNSLRLHLLGSCAWGSQPLLQLPSAALYFVVDDCPCIVTGATEKKIVQDV